jgi:cystathionine beta-lyase
MKKETICVHGGTYRDAATRGVNTPIFTSSSFEYLDRDDIPYPRYFNTPNQDAVVRKLCALEGAEDGVLFSSGMAAVSSAILAFAGAGDRLGIRHTFAATDAAAVADAVTPRTKVIVIESPTNPLLGIIDIRRVAQIGRERGIVTILDNTFATPVNQCPLQLGIDVVVHSGTKYLGGHSDLSCGAALTSRPHASKIRAAARHLGGSLNAMMCYLLERSLKTLSLRVERQTANAARIAAYLSAHASVFRVNYPGQPDSPGHEIARSQMTGFGAMLSFELDERIVSAASFLRRLRIIRPAVSLGGVETLICAPAGTSHAKISPEERRRIGRCGRPDRGSGPGDGKSVETHHGNEPASPRAHAGRSRARPGRIPAHLQHGSPPLGLLL